MEIGPAAREFPPDEVDLTREYRMYFQENRQSMAEKDPLIGRVDKVQTSLSK